MTHALSPKTSREQPKVLLSGLDRLYVSFFMDVSDCGEAIFGYAKRLGMVRYLKDGKNEVPGLPKVLSSLPRLLKEFYDENDWHDAVKDRVKAYRLGQ